MSLSSYLDKGKEGKQGILVLQDKVQRKTAKKEQLLLKMGHERGLDGGDDDPGGDGTGTGTGTGAAHAANFAPSRHLHKFDKTQSSYHRDNDSSDSDDSQSHKSRLSHTAHDTAPDSQSLKRSLLAAVSEEEPEMRRKLFSTDEESNSGSEDEDEDEDDNSSDDGEWVDGHHGDDNDYDDEGRRHLHLPPGPLGLC